jgi:hypothetical protein
VGQQYSCSIGPIKGEHLSVDRQERRVQGKMNETAASGALEEKSNDEF